jgi:hypothetical protein
VDTSRGPFNSATSSQLGTMDPTPQTFPSETSDTSDGNVLGSVRQLPATRGSGSGQLCQTALTIVLVTAAGRETSGTCEESTYEMSEPAR